MEALNEIRVEIYLIDGVTGEETALEDKLFDVNPDGTVEAGWLGDIETAVEEAIEEVYREDRRSPGPDRRGEWDPKLNGRRTLQPATYHRNDRRSSLGRRRGGDRRKG